VLPKEVLVPPNNAATITYLEEAFDGALIILGD
jgi:hypothetical protein